MTPRHRDYKERWQQFFEQAEEEWEDAHGSELGMATSFDELADRADELLADDEAGIADQVYEHYQQQDQRHRDQVRKMPPAQRFRDRENNL